MNDNLIRIHWMHRFNWDNSLRGLLKMSKVLDKHNIYSVLLPYGSTGPDYLVHVPRMVRVSKKLKFMIALRPYSLSPEYAAKIFKTFIQEYGKRITLNVVAGKLSPEEEKFVFKNYIGDLDKIDNVDKRIELAEEWTKVFLGIMSGYDPETYTIANAPVTLDLGNKYFDNVIFNGYQMKHNIENAVNTNMVLVIDPLITNKRGKSNAKYLYQPIDIEKGKGNTDFREQRHTFSGTYHEVRDELIDMSNKYGINDFIVHTDQKNIRQILRLCKELSKHPAGRPRIAKKVSPRP